MLKNSLVWKFTIIWNTLFFHLINSIEVADDEKRSVFPFLSIVWFCLILNCMLIMQQCQHPLLINSFKSRSKSSYKSGFFCFDNYPDLQINIRREQAWCGGKRHRGIWYHLHKSCSRLQHNFRYQHGCRVERVYHWKTKKNIDKISKTQNIVFGSEIQ